MKEVSLMEFNEELIGHDKLRRRLKDNDLKKMYQEFQLSFGQKGGFGVTFNVHNVKKGEKTTPENMIPDVIFKVLYRDDSLAAKSGLPEAVLRKNRQTSISNYLNENYGDLKKYFVRFTYYDDGISLISCRKVSLPLITMEKIEGRNLEEYIGECIKANNLRDIEALAKKWLELSEFLTARGIAHGDLQGENVLITKSGEIRLVDYDGMYVPTMDPNVFKGMGTEVGKPDYQHPKREEGDYFSKNLDNFSTLTIYLGLLALIEDPKRWKDHTDNSIYFTVNDYKNPSASEKIAVLQKSSNPEIRDLTKYLVEVLGYSAWNSGAQKTIDDIKPLAELIRPKPKWSIIRKSRSTDTKIRDIEKDPLIVVSDVPGIKVSSCEWYVCGIPRSGGNPISSNLELGEELRSYLANRNALGAEIIIRAEVDLDDGTISRVAPITITLEKPVRPSGRISREKANVSNESFETNPFIVVSDTPNLKVIECSWYIDGNPGPDTLKFGKELMSYTGKHKISAQVKFSDGGGYVSIPSVEINIY